ncbi:NfeD family protein [Desulfonatronovibrio hydrogenovorans]|uniref:NfeD family protein n=1 Tax=Desulfonatronovibrio hydrogenovorans TaxID=53245 RepID=UPI00048DA373|nr:nodulation protein NfeD [Desulfonatronovibrio hydrogenovorans]
MKKYYIFILLSFFILAAQSQSAVDSGSRILFVDIQGPITPAQEELLQESLTEAEQGSYISLVIRLDTPGGLAESMRNMVKLMLNAEVPVTVWVAPSGARAASAGVFLVAAADLAVMSPQTTIGSASPVDISGQDPDETISKKIVNELLSLIRSVAQERGRNVDWYEAAVLESANLDAEEALQLRVIDLIAGSQEDLLSQMGKRGLTVDGQEFFFDPAEIEVVTFEPGLKYKILSWLLHPQIAYLLFLAGMAGLFFEFSNPGAIFPGVVGAFCLILGLYSLSVLPTSVTGILLLILGFIFIIIEINIPTFGLLTLAALISFFFGSLFLFDPSYPYFQLQPMTILPVITILTLVLLALAFLIGKSQLAPKSDDAGVVSRTARIIEWNGTHGQIKVRGEIWNAATDQEYDMQPGQEVTVDKVEGMTVYIKP